MNKMTAVALVGLVAVSSMTSASKARQNGFGKSGTFVNDVQNVWSLPTTMLENKDATYFELGQGNVGNVGNGSANDVETMPWGGVHASLGGGVLGLWVNRPANDFDDFTRSTSFAPSIWGTTTPGQFQTFLGLTFTPSSLTNLDVLRATAPGSRVDVLYGMSLNDQVDLAIGLNRASFNFSTTDTLSPVTSKNTIANNSTGVLLGAAMKNLGPIAKLEIGLGFQTQSFLLSFENATTDKSTVDASGFGIRVAGDLSSEKGKISKFDITYASANMSSKDTPAVALPVAIEEKLSGSSYGLGYAMGMSNDKGMGLAGLILSGDSSTVDNSIVGTVDKVDNSSMTLDLVTAGEAKVKDWLVARAGLSGKIYGTTSVKNDVTLTSKDETTKEYPADATVSTGLSFLLGDITIDGVFNRDFLYTGPYFLSSSGDALINTQVSATWAWGAGKE